MGRPDRADSPASQPNCQGLEACFGVASANPTADSCSVQPWQKKLKEGLPITTCVYRERLNELCFTLFQSICYVGLDSGRLFNAEPIIILKIGGVLFFFILPGGMCVDIGAPDA